MSEKVTVDLEMTDCWCGLPFAMPKRLLDNCRKSGNTFYCPLGHSIVFKETEADKYRREAERLKQQIAQKDDEITEQRRRADSAWKSVFAYKGQLTKIRTRVKAGVCPCCNRQFQDLHRHMTAKHPDFDPAAENVVPFEKSA